MTEPDICNNPFFNCLSNIKEPSAIKVDIVVKGKTYHICEKCWVIIADSNYEWENEKW
jgi:hypothetical protein